MNANAIEGERARSAPETFSTGLYDIDAQAERYLLGRQHGTPSPPRSRRPTATALLTRVSQPERRFILELKEHFMDKCYLTYGLDGRFLLAQTQSAQARPRCRWRPGAPSEEIETRDSCTPVVLSSPTLLSCTSQPESPVPLAPCTTCGSRGASKKKSVGSRFVAESASPLGGELS